MSSEPNSSASSTRPADTIGDDLFAARGPLTRTFGLRLALWYATLFVIGAILIVLLTYLLMAASLEQRDRQIINAKLGEYAVIYERGGIDALEDTVRAEQRTAPEHLFVRVIDRGTVSIVLSGSPEWDESTLETGTIRLRGGTIVQVGKSTEARQDLLARFRAALGLVTLSIVVIALGGGLLATQSAVRPIRALIETVERIIRTGRTDARVAVARGGDAIADLTGLFNTMLDKIEGLVTAMRDALDNVSHDLRTPLTRLRGAAEMALAGEPDMERYRDALAECVDESDRVLVMLNTLMDISEAESGTMPLERESLQLGQIAERAMELYHDAADAKGVALETTSVADVTVRGDRTRLEQVAANLIDNAVKYTPSGGRIEVSVARDGDRALLRVRDSGAGIPADELPRIWDRLFRGDTSRTERGLGLGLSLVKAFVQVHGGSVDVVSEPGRGSIFTVALPAQVTLEHGAAEPSLDE